MNMKTMRTYSLNEESIKWLKTQKNKSKSLDDLIAKEVRNEINPDKVIEEIEKIDREVQNLVQKKTIILNKVSPILRDKHNKKVEELMKLKEKQAEILAEKRGFLRQVSKIEGINELLKPALEGKEFDYKKALGSCWGRDGWFGRLNETLLREYVESKVKK